jgi:RHS repeat-associated protein
VLTLTYNPANQLSSRTGSNNAYAFTGLISANVNSSVNGLNQIASKAGTAFAYDADGNLTSDGASTFGYDDENRLTSATGAKAATLTYDPLGRLATTTSAGATTRLLYDGDDLIAEYDGTGTLLRRYVHGNGADEPLIRYDGTGLTTKRHLHADERGSVIAVTSFTGALLTTNRYDEYGVPASTNAGRFQYTGQQWLPEVGLQYSKARMYDPDDGRFLQTDPVGYDGGINLYGYVGDDPVNGTDPSGTSEWWDYLKASLVGVTSRFSYVGITAHRVRANYDSITARLSSEVARTQLKRDTRVQTPREVRATIERLRPSLAPPPGSGGTANQTNAAWTKAAERLGLAGRGLAVVGAVTIAKDIATSDNPGRSIVANIGAIGGGLGGGAAVGAMVGWLGGPLAPVTVPAGALVGSAVGGYLGYETGEEVYDNISKVHNDASR